MYSQAICVSPYQYGKVYMYYSRSMVDQIREWFGQKRPPSQWTIAVEFDADMFVHILADLHDDELMSYSTYKAKGILPYTMYRQLLGQLKKEYYTIVRDPPVVRAKIVGMMEWVSRRRQLDADNTSCKYNCVYTDLTDMNRPVFSIVKHRNRDVYTFAYDPHEFTESQVVSILKCIFL